MKSIFAIVIGIILLSCNAQQGNQSELENTYFSISSYVEQLETRLKNKSALVTIRENGRLIDSALYNNFDFNPDLSTFKKGEIATPQHYGKYTVDTMPDKNVMCIAYETGSEKFTVKKLRVCQDENGQRNIWINREYKSLIAFLKQEIIIEHEAYTIYSHIKEEAGRSEVRIEKRVVIQ